MLTNKKNATILKKILAPAGAFIAGLMGIVIMLVLRLVEDYRKAKSYWR